MLLKVFSWLVTKQPSDILTAPMTPILFRVGSCNTTGSISSGGIHMAHRDPCCWKWHSSSNHRSMSFIIANSWSFFIYRLGHRIRFGNDRSRFTSTESQMGKQALTLPYSKKHRIFLRKVMAEKFSIPKVLRIFKRARGFSKIPADRFHNFFIPSLWTTRMGCIHKTCKTFIFKSFRPILNSPWAMIKKIRDFSATESLADQQNTMEAMIIPRFFGSLYLLLNRYFHNSRILDLKFTHGILLSASTIAERINMRNYLCRYVYIYPWDSKAHGVLFP